MKAWLTILVLTLVGAVGGLGGLAWSEPAQPVRVAADEGRFMTVPVYIDSGESTLAAYQFELHEAAGRMRVVGVESGEHPAFAEAPYFDREAVEAGRADRLIVAAYTTRPAESLPSGRTRVATVHVHVVGDAEPDWRLTLVRAGDAEAAPIEAGISTGPQEEG